MIPTNNDIQKYTIIFISLTIFKAFCSLVHKYKFNQLPQSSYETESTIATLLKIQMQFNFLSLHATLLFRRNLYSSELDLMLLISTILYTLILILTDYRSLLKIYRYENHILREDYPIIEFLGIQIFMMLGCALLITIQWFTIPLLSDLIYQLLCLYKVPSIIKSHQNNQSPNITYFCFLEDYCILIFFAYYRACPFNIFQLIDNLGLFISVATLICIQQCILLYQYHVRPQIYQTKSQVEEFANIIREEKIFQILEEGYNHECSICLQGVENTLQIQLQPLDPLVVTQCNHKFHESCLLVWLKVKKQCPVCRHQY